MGVSLVFQFCPMHSVAEWCVGGGEEENLDPGQVPTTLPKGSAQLFAHSFYAIME